MRARRQALYECVVEKGGLWGERLYGSVGSNSWSQLVPVMVTRS
jgi:hypothetical protein